MATDEARNDPDRKTAGFPLSDREQARNIVLFAAVWGLVYLAAPVLYVGLVQAALLEKLGADKATSNLPASIVLWMTPVPVLIAWLIPYVRHLKSVVCVAFLVSTAMGMVVVLALLRPTPNWVIPAVLLHAGALGATNGTIAAFMWELLGRGVLEARRGHAFSLAFGVGPILAVIGSLGSQLVLGGELRWSPVDHLDFRWNFALLYAASVPATALAALLVTRMVVPQPSVEPVRQPFFSGIFGGLGEFLRNRWIATTIIAYLLVYAGYMILPTMTLYTKTMTGAAAQDYVGYQNALRFGCKVLAGVFLGWLLTRTHPKANLLVTATLCLAGVLWVLVAPGKWFLLGFGILGAGELFGVYFPNYVLCCSAKSNMRRNMAFVSLVVTPAGFAPIFYGQIVDGFESFRGEKFAFQMSFTAAVVVLIGGILVVLFGLPRRPPPSELEGDVSHRS